MDEIHLRGWDVQKVDVNGDGLYEATVKNPYGETLAKVGPDPNTALGHALVGIMRQETMRYPRTSAWKATWENELPEIAKAYSEAPVYDPKAAGAWKELAEDSKRRAEAIRNQIHVEYTNDPYPYDDVNEMAKDIRDKQHVNISKANLSHPLWSTDQALDYRLVHDVLGHASVGGDWGWHGENGATSAHMPLLSPNAQKALFTEAIGQAAHNNVYRALAPQKIAFLDDYLAKAQDEENSAGHSGVHPSQSIVPTGVPSIEPEKTSSVPSEPPSLYQPGETDWDTGLCGEYALALRDLYPHLKLGAMGEKFDDGWAMSHMFAHDGTHLYDVTGKRPLQPYLDDPNTEVDLNYEHEPRPLEFLEQEGEPAVERAKQLIQGGGKTARKVAGNPSPEKLYHYTPEGNAESIEQRGLHPRNPLTGESYAEETGETSESKRPGVYMFGNQHEPLEHAQSGGNVFEVDTRGLPLVEDPFHADDSGTAYVSYDPIPPERLRRIAASEQLDPNDGWESGIEPLPDNAYLWQKEPNGTDPLDHQGIRDQAYKVDPGWFDLQDHEGMPDLESHRQAVANAFRSTLLEPRQTPRWAATHYQHIQNIPAGVSDPLRFADTLDAQRNAHNKARGLPDGIAHAEIAEGSKALNQWVKTMNPKLDDAEIKEIARRELFHMIAEEEERVTADDAGGQLTPMEISQAVHKSMKKRLAVLTKPRVDQKVDFGKDRLFHQGFNAPDPGVYGDFLHSHIRPIAGVGLNVDGLTRAAREDVAEHGGKGHHFRAKASDLIPGVGPREISHAWYKLQPHTSQLAIIGPSVAETLGHKRDQEVSPRDYFKLERQMAAGRDAAGYSHVPMGQFSAGMYDNMNYGPGVHRDLSPYKALNPTPYDQVDWTQYPNLATQDWADPYWWKSTEPNRDQVGKDWDQMVAVNHPAQEIPYRTAAAPGGDYQPVGPDLTNGQYTLPPTAQGVLPSPYVIHPTTGEEIEGDPGMSLMQHVRNSLGLSTEEAWALDPEAGKR